MAVQKGTLIVTKTGKNEGAKTKQCDTASYFFYSEGNISLSNAF